MSNLNQKFQETFDLWIATCGYETRASYIVQHHPPNSVERLVLDYNCPGILSYDANHAIYTQEAFTFIAIDMDLEIALSKPIEEIRKQKSKGECIRVFFDVSSCSRSVMARVLLMLSKNMGACIEVTCAYALSAYNNPPTSELPSHISEPVVGDLAGWSQDLMKPPCAVIGLGFEPGRALGCIDYLEIPEVRLFMPFGPDERFMSAVKQANRTLIGEASNISLLPYDILDAQGSYERLQSLILGLLPNYRPVIIPLGPKIFAAFSIVLAIELSPRVCVWRTSAGSGSEVTDRTASGEISSFQTHFQIARISGG